MNKTGIKSDPKMPTSNTVRLKIGVVSLPLKHKKEHACICEYALQFGIAPFQLCKENLHFNGKCITHPKLTINDKGFIMGRQLGRKHVTQKLL